jgi:hypothetical protein
VCALPRLKCPGCEEACHACACARDTARDVVSNGSKTPPTGTPTSPPDRHAIPITDADREADAWLARFIHDVDTLKAVRAGIFGIIAQVAASARAEERRACEAIARMLPQTPRVNVANAIADAISRRSP